MRIVTAALAGLLFGVGLAMSGMLDPVRVLGFLDVAGVWDPSIAFVLGGAVAVSAIGTLLAKRLAHPALTDAFDVPTNRRIDARLLGGSALFGVGWGLAGFCPRACHGGLVAGLAQGVSVRGRDAARHVRVQGHARSPPEHLQPLPSSHPVGHRREETVRFVAFRSRRPPAR